MITAIVPLKSFAGLTRLADALPTERRAALVVQLAKRTTDALRGADADVVVVTGDPSVSEWASQQRFRVVDEPDPPGLDAAAEAGLNTVRGEWMVVHADLPLISTEDVRAVQQTLATIDHVLAPSHDGGTSLIGGTGPTFPFAYGAGSFRRHLSLVPDAAVLVRLGLALDVDHTRDLVALRTLASL